MLLLSDTYILPSCYSSYLLNLQQAVSCCLHSLLSFYSIPSTQDQSGLISQFKQSLSCKQKIQQLDLHLKTFLRSVPQLLTVAYTDTEENWIQNQFQLLQDQYTSVVPDKQYFDDLINLLLWNIPVSETFIATWFKMIIERARRVLKIHPGKDCLCLFFKDHPGHGLHSTEVAYLILTQQPWNRFSVFPRVFLFMLMRYLDILTALPRTVDTGKWLDNVN